MIASRIIFNFVMLLFPAAVCCFYRARGADVDHDLLRTRRIRLGVATAVALAVTAVLWIGAHQNWFSFWARIPRFMTWSSTPAELAWLLWFPLWFVFAMPVIVAARPMRAGPHPANGATRTASLARRTATTDVPRGRWVLGWAIWTVGLLTIGIGALAGKPSDQCIMAAFFLIGGGLPPLLITPWALRRLPGEPEPLDLAGTPELVEAYALHRGAKARGFAALAIAMVGVFTALALAVMIWPERPAMLGIAGGIGGTLIGVCGAIFGTRMSADRAKIRRLLEELSRVPDGSEAGTGQRPERNRSAQ